MLLLSPSSHATHDEQDRGTLSPRRTGESPFLLPPLPPGLASQSQFLVSMCTLHSVATKIQYRAGEEKGRLLVWEVGNGNDRPMLHARWALIFCVQQAPFGKCLLTGRASE